VKDRAPQRDRAPISTEGSGTRAPTPGRRRPIPFGLHQIVEYLLAVVLVVLSVHIGGSDLLLIGGIAFGLLALTARGPFGLLRLCPARLHGILDVVVAVALALSPLVRPLRPGIVSIVVIEVVAVAWLRVSMLTRYRPPASSADSASTDPAAAAAPSARPASAPADDPTPGPALGAIRHLGRLSAGARQRLPEAQGALESGARQLGTHSGRLQRAWRRTTR
jgi:hypothetical protein